MQGCGLCCFQLLTRYRSDRNVREFVDKLDWYFLVVANPDGYDYTFTGVSLFIHSQRQGNFQVGRSNLSWNRNTLDETGTA